MTTLSRIAMFVCGLAVADGLWWIALGAVVVSSVAASIAEYRADRSPP